jgi:hypothetical protein
MSKGKEAITSRNKRISELEMIINTMYFQNTELAKRAVEAENELMQLQVYRDRVNELNKVYNALADERIENKRLSELVTLWEERAKILAEADREAEENNFTVASMGVLADMKMLPKVLSQTRTMRRNARNGSALVTHNKVIDEVIKEVKSRGVKVRLESV